MENDLSFLKSIGSGVVLTFPIFIHGCSSIWSNVRRLSFVTRIFLMRSLIYGLRPLDYSATYIAINDYCLGNIAFFWRFTLFSCHPHRRMVEPLLPKCITTHRMTICRSVSHSLAIIPILSNANPYLRCDIIRRANQLIFLLFDHFLVHFLLPLIWQSKVNQLYF